MRGGTLPLRDADRNDGPVLPIPMGSAVKENAPRAPVTALVMLLGMTDPEIERCVEQVASLQVMLAGFCPLFVTDSDAFQFFRRYEYLFEYLPPADAYIAQHGVEEWTEFVNERLRSIIATYQPQRIIVLGGSSSSHAIERGLLDPFLQAPEID